MRQRLHNGKPTSIYDAASGWKAGRYGSGRRWRVLVAWRLYWCQWCGELRSVYPKPLMQVAYRVLGGRWVVRSRYLKRLRTKEPTMTAAKPRVTCECPRFERLTERQRRPTGFPEVVAATGRVERRPTGGK